MSMLAGSPLVHLVADSGLPRDVARGYPLSWREKDMQDQLLAPYVWFRDGGPEASRLSGLALATGFSYLIAHKDGQPRLVKSWQFPETK